MDYKDITFTLDDKKYVLDVEFIKLLNKLLEEINHSSVKERIKVIKNCLSARYDLNYSIYKQKRIIDVMLNEFFSDEELDECLYTPYQKEQRKYYRKHKQDDLTPNTKYRITKEVKE